MVITAADEFDANAQAIIQQAPHRVRIFCGTPHLRAYCQALVCSTKICICSRLGLIETHLLYFCAFSRMHRVSGVRFHLDAP